MSNINILAVNIVYGKEAQVARIAYSVEEDGKITIHKCDSKDVFIPTHVLVEAVKAQLDGEAINKENKTEQRISFWFWFCLFLALLLWIT